MGQVVSVNVGVATASDHAAIKVTGIDKRPAAGPVEIREPGPKGVGGSGLVGDDVCDRRHHGGSDQAVYAYAREDLDEWQALLGRSLGPGVFGENLTTTGLDVTGALLGERWRVGRTCELEVTSPRIPCRTFAGWLGERGWVARFTAHARPGAYFRVRVPGPVRAGDPVVVLDRPDHDVTIGLTFRALTAEAGLLPTLLAAGPHLPEEARRRALRHRDDR